MRRFPLLSSFFFSILLLIFVSILVVLFVPAVQLALVRYGAGILEERHAYRIEIESFHLRVSGELNVTGLNVTGPTATVPENGEKDDNKADGIAVRVDNLRARFAPSALRERTMEISELRLEDTTVDISAISATSATSADRATPDILNAAERVSDLERQIIETLENVPPWTVAVDRLSLRNTTVAALPAFDADAAFHFASRPARLSVSGLDVVTGESSLAATGSLALGEVADPTETTDPNDRQTVFLQDVEVSTRIGSDLLDLPDLHHLPGGQIPEVLLETRFRGTLDTVEIETLEVIAGGDDPILEGDIRGILSFAGEVTPRFNGEIRRLRLARDAVAWLEPGPEWLELSGAVDLSPDMIVVDLSGSSDLGRGSLAATIDPPGPGTREYRFSVEQASVTVPDLLVPDLTTRFSMEGTAGGPNAFDLSLTVYELTAEDEAIRDMELSLARDGDHSRLDVESAGFRVRFDSSVPLDRIGDHVTGRLRRVLATGDDPAHRSPASTHGTVSLDLEVTEPPSLLVPLVPGLEELSAVSASFLLDTECNEMYGRALVDRLVYDDAHLDGVRVALAADDSVLRYTLRTDRVRLGERLVHGPAVHGSVGRRDLNARFSYEDAAGQTAARVGLEARETDEGWEVSLVGDDPVLALSGGGGIDRADLSPIRFEVDRFDLARDLPFQERIPLGFGGVLSAVGKFTLGDRVEESELSTTVTVDNLVVDRREIGLIVVDVQRERDGRIAARGRLHRGVDTLALEGTYHPRLGTGEVTVEIEYLSIDYLATFVPEEVSDLQGHLQGRIRARGSPSDPVVTGDLLVRNTAFSVPRTGTSYVLEDQRIAVDRNLLRLSSFSISDQHGAELALDGTVEIGAATPEEVELDLALRSRRFSLLDTVQRQAPRFHGRVIVSSDLRLRGTVDAPEVTGSVGLAPGSALTLVLPESGPVGGDAEQVVRFVDSEDPARSEVSTPGRTPVGIDLSVAVDVDRETELVLIVDQRSGDRLNIRGGGDFSLGIDPGGAVRLSGQYTITGGRYLFSFFNIARREFPIVPGSSITWTGDPLEANLDVEAMYTVRTSPAPLLATAARHGIAGDLPFQVLLGVEGRLTAPEVSFSIDMPPGERGALGGSVYAAVSHLNEQESRRNTQAFSLIVLNQFVRDDLSGIDEAAVVTGGARSSASRLLTYQLNALSNRYVPGIDLTFDVDSYEAATEAGPEARTELQVELSRRFLDDRLVVRFGSRFDLEGERREETGWSDLAGDLSAEYALTPDGRYRLRAFREREQQSVLEGYRTVTGLSLLFSRDFDLEER